MQFGPDPPLVKTSHFRVHRVQTVSEVKVAVFMRGFASRGYSPRCADPEGRPVPGIADEELDRARALSPGIAEAAIHSALLVEKVQCRSHRILRALVFWFLVLFLGISIAHGKQVWSERAAPPPEVLCSK